MGDPASLSLLFLDGQELAEERPRAGGIRTMATPRPKASLHSGEGCGSLPGEALGRYLAAGQLADSFSYVPSGHHTAFVSRYESLTYG